MSIKVRVAKLRKAGDDALAEKDYLKASRSYSAGILLDGENYWLYLGQSEALLHMEVYILASTNAEKAVKLDDRSVEAWMLRATCAGYLNEPFALTWWKKALGMLPSSNLTAQQQKQKKRCKEGIKAWHRSVELGTALLSDKGDIATLLGDEEWPPWKFALAIKPRLFERGNNTSSAHGIASAYLEIRDGVRSADYLITSSNFAWEGVSEALTRFTNGVMHDLRVFHLTGDKYAWLEKINTQALHEMKYRRCEDWVDGGPQKVISEALVRLRGLGWKYVRPALATTVRSWILRATIQTRVHQRRAYAVELLHNAIEVINWGRNQWPDLDRDTRGAIFEDTFIRGVRVLYMYALKDAYVHKASGTNRSDTLMKIFAVTDDLAEEINRPDRSRHYDRPEMRISFEVYPAAFAHMMRAFCADEWSQRGNGEVEVLQKWARTAARDYAMAASVFPRDDELHPWSLKCALDVHWRLQSPLRETLPLADRVRISFPDMVKIWQHSDLAKEGRDEILSRIIQFHGIASSGIKRGDYTLDDVLTLDILEVQHGGP
ncbi:hypothetical protein PLICRDRAFT_174691 [Plicaturopsis crispa FD-325 SS-3]|nr:hypothetical protein PLICRDRAFT_174691 [Plicaturopsis crispa FD-325 SS-3]